MTDKKIFTTTRATREFHVARAARERFQLEEALFSLAGNLILIDFSAARTIVQQMNDKLGTDVPPEKALYASDLNAMGLIDEILHFVIGQYQEQEISALWPTALDWLDAGLGAKKVDAILTEFLTQFPPNDLYQSKQSFAEYLSADNEEGANRELVLEELLVHWLANANPAFAPFSELFDDSELEAATRYSTLIDSLKEFFADQPPFGPDNQNLIAMLRSPVEASPDSLAGQLRYIMDKWGYLLGSYLMRLLRGLDFISEETKARGFGPGDIPVLQFGAGEGEYERFSPDSEWMPRVVMIAKNTLVWLDQLSKQYQRPVERLDQVPDEELDRLARYGFTALWLIGLWERSDVSQKIKQWCGNPEAEASAYSLKRYVIADALGGPAAFQNLKDRCWQRGIRVASDMVPNHTGLDSDWLIEHPAWFVQLDNPPFPGYKYESGNLSDDGRVSIRVEDQYYSQSDAAVTFQHIDNSSGQVRYIYHGNDGTSMPWNDTAQLNYLLPEVREAVIQTILHVARQTSIIRFDAAMTLAKKHIQRLWFPEPGSGGDIPSRAEHGLSHEEFHRLLPQEFWREVVDRVAEEVPHTLLLAEAFWMMEGYFVRTLGMHRVYNSAFMNMLKMENNVEYRQTIKNTLEFDPQILKRFVNFLNNPDEETAAVQFGDGDKYFGVTMLMLTMPGLPMFGHGQIEGYREKYGMEFRRAYWDEYPDENLVARHEQEIFPVLRKRYLFAEVENFCLFDLFSGDGNVNENVFAHTNRHGDERALVFYNNAYQSAAGWIKTSAAYNDKERAENGTYFVQKSLAEALEISGFDDHFTILRDEISGLEYLRSSRDIFNNGIYVELNGYQYQVYLNIREVRDNAQEHYRRLYNTLNGRGVPGIEQALTEMFLSPIHDSLTALVENAGEEIITTLVKEITDYVGGTVDIAELVKEIDTALANTVEFRKWLKKSKAAAAVYLRSGLSKETPTELATTLWAILRYLGKIKTSVNYEAASKNLINELNLVKPISVLYQKEGYNQTGIDHQLQLLKILIQYQNHLQKELPTGARAVFRSLLDDAAIHDLLGINSWEGTIWFNHEGFTELSWWLLAMAAVDKQGKGLKAEFTLIRVWLQAMKKSEYRLEELLGLLK